jgi:hypothetical protein
MADNIMLVLTNAVPGTDDDFNAWYDDTHLVDVLEHGPFTGARRFRLADADATDAPYRYLAVYDIEDGKAEEARDWIVFSRAEREEALAAGRDPLIPISPTLADERIGWFFTEISQRSAVPA